MLFIYDLSTDLDTGDICGAVQPQGGGLEKAGTAIAQFGVAAGKHRPRGVLGNELRCKCWPGEEGCWLAPPQSTRDDF